MSKASEGKLNRAAFAKTYGTPSTTILPCASSLEDINEAPRDADQPLRTHAPLTCGQVSIIRCRRFIDVDWHVKRSQSNYLHRKAVYSSVHAPIQAITAIPGGADSTPLSI